MQQVSEAYKTEQKQHLREKSYVWVYLGVVDRTAQRTAQIDDSTPVTEWSKLPTGNDLVEGVYATYEENFFRADGSMMFPPEGAWGTYQGAASAGIGGSIKFEFESVCNIRGLSLKFFDDAIPLTFKVTNGIVENTYTYNGVTDVDEHGVWWCEDEYVNSSYITIIPLTLKGGNQRLRIQRILFGKGFYFEDKDLLSTSFTNTVSHLSDKLPSKTFTFTISNLNKTFSADDPHSFVHFLQEQQEVQFDYGRELPGGGIEKIKGGRLCLKNWSTDDQKATFNAVGYLEFMDTTYHKGQFYTMYYTLYDLAEMVLQDAGVTEYHLDESLTDHLVSNPLPVEKHKNLLQLIANAGKCIFYEDRDGVLTIAPAYEGTVENVTDYTLEYKDLLNSPNAATTEFVKNVVCQYYGFEFSQYESQIGSIEIDKVNQGDNFILFSEPMKIDQVVYEDRPRHITWESETFDMSLNDDISVEIDHGNIIIDGVLVYDGYESSLRFGESYTISIRNDAGAVATVRAANYLYWKNTYFNSIPDAFVRIEYDHYYTATITERGAYYIRFTTDHVSKMLLYGNQVTLNTLEVTNGIQGRNIGVDKTCKNILISDDAWAEDNLDWMIDYYDDDIEYTLDYRGEPALDCDDVIYLDSQYVSKNYVRITESTINTSQGMGKCTLKARRSSWKDFARVDYAVVDGNEVK